MHALFILWIRNFGGGRVSDPRTESKPICLIIVRLCAVRRVEGDTEVAQAQAPLTSQSSREKRTGWGWKDTATTAPSHSHIPRGGNDVVR